MRSSHRRHVRRVADMSDSGAFPRVGVNLLWLLPGRVGGSEQATMRQLSALAELPEATNYHLFCTPEVARAHPRQRLSPATVAMARTMASACSGVVRSPKASSSAARASMR